MTAHCFTVLVMKRSILTEKVARRGYHITREYSVDPLESLSVGDVMTTAVVSIPAALPVREVLSQYFFGEHQHPGYPVVDKLGNLLGMISRTDLLEGWMSALLNGETRADVLKQGPIIAYDLIGRSVVTIVPAESCRAAAELMAQSGAKQLPVVSATDPNKMVGIVSLTDLLKARQHIMEEEAKRERFFGPGLAKHAVPTD